MNGTDRQRHGLVVVLGTLIAIGPLTIDLYCRASPWPPPA